MTVHLTVDGWNVEYLREISSGKVKVKVNQSVCENVKICLNLLLECNFSQRFWEF